MNLMANNPLKRLASETAIYGITHTLGRFLNFLLVPLYTSIFPIAEYGIVNVYYSVVGFAIVLLLYGMETAFFNFARNNPPEKTFSTALTSVGISTIIFLAIGLLFRQQVADFLEYPDQTNYVVIFVFILALDALSALPFAWLRFENKALKFGAIRLTNIGIYVGLNLFFLVLLPHLETKGLYFSFYDPEIGIGYVFISNLVASFVTFLLLLPNWQMLKLGFDKAIWKKMLRYGRPLIWVGLAGIVNESLDRILLKKLLPVDIGDYQIGIYSAFYKLSIVMTLAVQSFRFGAEPFFFKEAKQANAKQTYARVMHVFVLALTTIFLATAVFAEPIGKLFIRNPEFFEHPQWRYLVPILLLANMFLGIMYNLNIWYKLNDKTRIGMYISIGGAAVTLILNFVLIPIIGILGSAITTLVSYAGMATASYLMGRKHYPIPYNLRLIFFYISLSVALYFAFELVRTGGGHPIITGLITLVIFGLAVFFIERPTKKP